jgi:ABC-type transporter Mla MlaB component
LPESNGDHLSRRDGGVPWNGSGPSARAAGDGVVDLDVSWLVPADLAAVDALARLQVAASRCGRRLRLHGADGGLAELLEFVGLSDIVHLCPCCGGASWAANRRCAGADRSAEPPA